MKSWIKRLNNWLFGFTGTLIYCPKCKSSRVKFGEITKNEGIVGNMETYPVTCLDCGAEGIVSETWK